MPTELDEKQAKCYLDRYADVKSQFGSDKATAVQKAQEHWKEKGRNAGRDSSCEFVVMTQEEAQCYLYRYPDVAALYGTNNTDSVAKA
jgi:hypothetical protein